MSSINAQVLNAMYQQVAMTTIENDVRYAIDSARVEMFEKTRRSNPVSLHTEILKEQTVEKHQAQQAQLVRPSLRRANAMNSTSTMKHGLPVDPNKSSHIDRDLRVLLSRRNMYGDTPLTTAVRGGMDTVMGMLLEAGAKPNRVDKMGWTPLMYAARDNRIEMMAMLIVYGADKDTVNKEGETAQTIALKHGAIDFMQTMTRIVMTRNKVRV